LETVLAKTERLLCWWIPARQKQMFYENVEGRAKALNGRTFPQPPLVWRVTDGQLHVRALVDNKRPPAHTRLAVAPFWNLSENGLVCTGSMRRPAGVTAATIPGWEKGFYESAFTHANVGRITRHVGGFEGLWSELVGKRTRFPAESLIVLPQTLAQFVRGERY
jgi:PRTRC genetic system protein B